MEIAEALLAYIDMAHLDRQLVRHPVDVAQIKSR
jgi:hypothetical protein